jgi:hypothetical protein
MQARCVTLTQPCTYITTVLFWTFIYVAIRDEENFVVRLIRRSHTSITLELLHGLLKKEEQTAISGMETDPMEQ